MSSQEILVINKRGEIIFESGSGKLTKAKEIVATITQALQLYSKQILQEEIQFIRFQNQRMFFLSSEKELIAVQLINKNLLTKQFLPALKILLRIIDTLSGIMNQKNKPIISDSSIKGQLSVFFNIISDPSKTLIVVPKNHMGFLSLIVLFSGFFFDLSKKIEALLTNIVLLDADESLTQMRNNCEKILAIGVPINKIKVDNNILSTSTFLIGRDSNIILSDMNNTSLTREVANYFGSGSNAERIYNLTNSADVDDIANQLTQLPREADDILLEALKESIENSGKNLTKVLYRNLIKKIREKETEKLTSRAALGYVETPKPPVDIRSMQKEIISESPPVFVDAPLEKSVVETPTASGIQEQVRPSPGIPIDLESDTSKVLLETAPILIDAKPYVIGKSQVHPQYALSMQIQPIKGDLVEFYIFVGSNRVQEFHKSISDLESRISGELIPDEGGVMLTIPKDQFYTAYKGIIWSLFIEYAYQVQLDIFPKSEIFKVPNEGSVCVIPDGLTPNRKKQLPKQIIEVFDENVIIEELETENPITIAKSIDSLLLKVLNMLKKGNGCAVVPRQDSQEIPEIIEFLLILSEMCGIGWSRW